MHTSRHWMLKMPHIDEVGWSTSCVVVSASSPSPSPAASRPRTSAWKEHLAAAGFVGFWSSDVRIDLVLPVRELCYELVWSSAGVQGTNTSPQKPEFLKFLPRDHSTPCLSSDCRELSGELTLSSNHEAKTGLAISAS